jgi:replicative DNA helicase
MRPVHAPQDVVRLTAEVPRADDAEEAVLGAVLANNALLSDVAGRLTAGHFAQFWCGQVFTAMLALAKENQPIDFITLKTKLGPAFLERVGAARLATLGDGVPRSTNITHYADIIVDASRRRDAIRKATEIIESALAPAAEADDVISVAQEAFFRLAASRRGKTLFSASELTSTVLTRFQAMDERGGSSTGLASGIWDLDILTHGFQPGELVVIGARPSVGKTGLALHIGLQVAEAGGQVLFCSCEMGAVAVWERAVFNRARVDGYKFKRGFLAGDADTGRRIAAAVGQLEPLPFWIDEQPGMSSVDVRSKAQQIQLRHGLSLLLVDYLQLMKAADERSTRGQLRSQIIGEMARDLKEIARTLGVTVVVLSQLRRLEDGKRPTMADLRESGDIEAHADIILLLHRSQSREQLAALEPGAPATLDLLIEKQRGNPIGEIQVLNYREQYRFASATRGDRDPHLETLSVVEVA